MNGEWQWRTPDGKTENDIAMPVRTQARNVRSFARWSLRDRNYRRVSADIVGLGSGIRPRKTLGQESSRKDVGQERRVQGKLFYGLFKHCADTAMFFSESSGIAWRRLR